MTQQCDIWRQPGYTGKLKPTPSIPGQPRYVQEAIDQNSLIEYAYELFATGLIDDNTLNALILKSYAQDHTTTL